jgi:hypothetical protein
MIKLLTQAYRFYNFYSSIDKFLLRRAVRKLLAKRRSYDQALEIGAGTALAINRLFVDFIHDRMGATEKGWRAQGLAKKVYFCLMTAALVAVTVLSWLALAFDVVFDRNPANSTGYVLIGSKQGTKVEA